MVECASRSSATPGNQKVGRAGIQRAALRTQCEKSKSKPRAPGTKDSDSRQQQIRQDMAAQASSGASLEFWQKPHRRIKRPLKSASIKQSDKGCHAFGAVIRSHALVTQRCAQSRVFCSSFAGNVQNTGGTQTTGFLPNSVV